MGVVAHAHAQAMFLLSSEWLPQELLPSIPPIVQRLWVAGSGPKKSPACFLRLLAEMIQHTARLHMRQPPARVDVEHMVHVFRKIEHHRDIAALPGQARSPAPRRIGASCSRASRTAASTSSACRGITTPMGTWR